MYDCRCPRDGKKLAEIARPPLPLDHYDYPCECGRGVRGRIVLEKETGSILAVASCPCGCATRKVVGHVVTITCPKCKTVVNFYRPPEARYRITFQGEAPRFLKPKALISFQKTNVSVSAIVQPFIFFR
ncbi:MAG: hypothetical protein A4E74_01891 [Syntrophus sp. PtaB.Bin075]|nr:MAG: hypothetical protein A4E74_01891 [Syntrophus sp. PtaB.Bin075]